MERNNLTDYEKAVVSVAAQIYVAALKSSVTLEVCVVVASTLVDSVLELRDGKNKTSGR